MIEPALSGVVAWSDTDASGHYHHTAAFRWVENAEHQLCRTIAPGVDIGRFPRRAVAATFHRPLYAGDVYCVHLQVERIGGTSLTWRWQLLTGDVCCAEGRYTAVHIGDGGRPAPLPEELRVALADYRETGDNGDAAKVAG